MTLFSKKKIASIANIFNNSLTDKECNYETKSTEVRGRIIGNRYYEPIAMLRSHLLNYKSASEVIARSSVVLVSMACP